MKCPACGDTQQQRRLAAPDPGSLAYRCAKCGRLYTVPIMDLTTLIDRLGELAVKAAELEREQRRLQLQIVAAKEQAQSAREYIESVERRLRGETHP